MNQGREGGENTLFLGVGLGVLILIGLYWVFKVEIIHFIFWLKFYELKFIALFAPHYDELINWVSTVSAGKVTTDDIYYLSKSIGVAIMYPAAFILIFLAVIAFLLHPEKKYRSRHSMTSLAKSLSSHFPSYQIISHVDLVNEDVCQGPWAMARTPVEFAKDYRLLIHTDKEFIYRVNRNKAKIVFRSQMGQLWRGIDGLEVYEKFVFAVLAAYINYDRDTPEDMLEKVCLSVTKETLLKRDLDFGAYSLLIDKYLDSEKVSKLCANHAYFHTLIASMLEEARATGIVANSAFLWLKPIDRSLWYTMNNIGRKAVFPDAAAVHAHWLVEKQLGQPIKMPMIEEAVNALDEAIGSRLITH